MRSLHYWSFLFLSALLTVFYFSYRSHFQFVALENFGLSRRITLSCIFESESFHDLSVFVNNSKARALFVSRENFELVIAEQIRNQYRLFIASNSFADFSTFAFLFVNDIKQIICLFLEKIIN